MLTTVFAVIGFLSIALYVGPLLFQTMFFNVQNLKKKYNAQWALVTGGSSGIGLAMSETLASQGINVVVAALNDKAMESAKVSLPRKFPGIQFRFVSVNLGAHDPTVYMTPLIEATNDISVQLVFNNAGYILVGLFHLTSLEAIMSCLNCNNIAAVQITHHFTGRLVAESQKGAVFFTSSPGGFMASPMAPLYSTTKSFLTNFAVSIAAELTPNNIDVCVIHPSPTNTAFYNGAGNMSTLTTFQKMSGSPQAIVDAALRCIGRTVNVEHGWYTVGNRLLLKILDYTVMSDLMWVFVRGQGDYEKIRVGQLEKLGGKTVGSVTARGGVVASKAVKGHARSRNTPAHKKPDHFNRPNARPGPSHNDPETPEVLVNVANFTWVNGFDLYDTAPGVPAWTEYFAAASLGPTGQLVVPAELERCSIKGSKVWGASFDDGPSEFTHYVQDYFKMKGLLTTFFVVGSQIAMFPSVLQDSYNAGHGIGIHTWSHAKLTTLSDDQIVAELVLGAKAIVDTLGIYPKYFRPPYGASDERVLRLAASVGLTSIVWTADSGDSEDSVDVSESLTNEIVPANFETFVSEGRDKDISLQHDRWEYEAKVASTAMDILLTGGYNIMPIHDCLEDANPYDNKIMEGFFKSGQFENKLTVMPPYMVAATATAVVTGDAGINNVATTASKQSAAAPGGFQGVLGSLAAFMALILSV
ncbi:hypothetical protein HDU78_001947 [Chytriomyces hyalinus]|nr:hypothetical protein HDU78_001947 [Chytriomyces hyalinus]